MNRLLFAAVALALAGCNSSTAPAPKTPDQIVAAIEASYTGAVTLATQYLELPRCGVPHAPALCSDPKLVGALTADQAKASASLNAARAALAVGDAGSTQAALATAAADIGTFATAAAALGVK